MLKTNRVGTKTPAAIRASMVQGMRDYDTRIRATRKAQGLPDRVCDPAVLDRIAADYSAWEHELAHPCEQDSRDAA